MAGEFDHPNLSPSDAVVALRSFPRRFRGLLATDDDDPEGVAMRRPDAAGWSAREHAAHVANAVEQAAADLQAAHREEGAAVADPAQAPPSGATDVDSTLAHLSSASDALVAAIDRYNPDDWKRTVRAPDGRTVDALWIVRAAVQEGARHLRQAEQVIAQVKGRPPQEDD
ncbi:MAG: DinB family protein [Actinobacteria bacterium]|nr:DinB family protein [Actinomycetota bacterium]